MTMTKPTAALFAAALLALTTGCGQTPATSLAPAALAAPATLQAAGATGTDAAAGVTPAMIAALATLLDANKDGLISKNEGFVELLGPEKTKQTLISNYYDAAYQQGDQVAPLPVKTFTERLGQGYDLDLKAICGEKGYDTIPMSDREIARLASGVADVLAKSPLLKGGLLGGLPVRRVVQPHYAFRKATDHVEIWSMHKVASTIEKTFQDKSRLIRIDTHGTHAEGPFVLEVHESPVM